MMNPQDSTLERYVAETAPDPVGAALELRLMLTSPLSMSNVDDAISMMSCSLARVETKRQFNVLDTAGPEKSAFALLEAVDLVDSLSLRSGLVAHIRALNYAKYEAPGLAVETGRSVDECLRAAMFVRVVYSTAYDRHMRKVLRLMEARA